MLDIEDFVYRNFPNPQPYGSPISDLRVECPFCDSRIGYEDTKGKLHISLNVQAVHCFRCGYSASWIAFAMKVLGCNYSQALGELYVKPKIRGDISKILLDTKSISKKALRVSEEVSLPDDFIPLYDKCKDSLVEDARKYATKRGFGEWHWKRYNLGVAESVGWRLIIPVEKEYWQARSMKKWLAPKYINPKISAREFIFNSDALNAYEEVVICEGCFSAMAVGDNAIAILGKEIPEEKFSRLANSYTKRFVVALDFGAEVWSTNLANKLQRFGKVVTVWDFVDEHDPADGGKYIAKEYNLKTHISF